MSIITKKTWPEAFQLILDGKKTYDLRLADFDCNPGDILVLQEWNPETNAYTGREIRKKVGFVGKTKDWEVWPKADIDRLGYQVISLLDE